MRYFVEYYHATPRGMKLIQTGPVKDISISEARKEAMKIALTLMKANGRWSDGNRMGNIIASVRKTDGSHIGDVTIWGSVQEHYFDWVWGEGSGKNGIYLIRKDGTLGRRI